jgi:hypothetical protein
MKTTISYFKNIGLRLILAVIPLLFVLSNATIDLSVQTAIAPDASTFMAIASSSDQAAQKANEAAKKVTQEDSIKEKFGQTEQGEEMIDKALETADKKLSSLAKKTQEKQDLEKLPPHEQNFLENLQGE